MPSVITDTDTLLAVHKPAGLITHRDGRTQEPSLAGWIAARYPALVRVGEPWVSPQGEQIPVCGLVHRLDRTTSGVILAAKDDATFMELKHAFREQCVEKRYLALVHGHPPTDGGTITAEIARTGTVPKRWYAKPCAPDSRRAAVTQWRVLARMHDAAGNPASLVEAMPRTGRTHQIRVHLSSIGHPIVADHLYAGEMSSHFGFARPALHAHSISVLLRGVRHAYEAALPPDFTQQLFP